MSQTIVGKLNKAFGIKGQIKVVPQKPYIADLKKSDVWFIERGNDVIPYFVESIEEDPHFLIKFEDIDSPEEAKNITGCNILLRDKDINIRATNTEKDLDKLLGFIVENGDELVGEIVRIEEYPQQLMAFVDNGKIEFMMPLAHEYIVDIDTDARTLSVVLPAGLLESQL